MKPNLQATDPFAVLGIPRGSTREKAHHAYLRLSIEHHPDNGGSADNFHRIAAAYEEIKQADFVVGDLFDFF